MDLYGSLFARVLYPAWQSGVCRRPTLRRLRYLQQTQWRRARRAARRSRRARCGGCSGTRTPTSPTTAASSRSAASRRTTSRGGGGSRQAADSGARAGARHRRGAHGDGGCRRRDPQEHERHDGPTAGVRLRALVRALAARDEAARLRVGGLSTWDIGRCTTGAPGRPAETRRRRSHRGWARSRSRATAHCAASTTWTVAGAASGISTMWSA